MKPLREQPLWVKILIGIGGFFLAFIPIVIIIKSFPEHMEGTAILFMFYVVTYPFFFYKLAVEKSTKSDWPSRTCLVCKHTGPMKTWLGGYSGPQFIALILLFFYLIPGLIFIAWGWGKYKCPICGTLGKSIPAAKEAI